MADFKLNGTTPDDVRWNGTTPQELRYNGEVIWPVGFYLDMTDASDAVSYSGQGLQIQPGNTFLIWVSPQQVGSSGSARFPGIFSAGTAGGWDDYFSLQNDDGTSPQTTGTVNTIMFVETNDGEGASSESFVVDLDAQEFHLVGFVYHSDESLTFFHNDTTVATRSSHTTTGTHFDIIELGYGYAGATNDGSGGKWVDGAGLWKRELTQTEVSDWYNNDTIPDNPSNFWKYDDDTDTTVAVDAVGSADGTVNGATYVSGGVTTPGQEIIVDTTVDIETWEGGTPDQAWENQDFTIVTTQVYEGSYAAESPPGSGNLRCYDYENSGNNLDRYQRIGDKVRSFFYHDTSSANVDGNTRAQWAYGGDWGNNYVIRWDIQNENLRLWKNGFGSIVGSTFSIVYPGSEWWAIESEWGTDSSDTSSPTHTVRLMNYSDPSNPVEEASIVADDAGIDDTSCGHYWSLWNASSVGTMYGDYAHFYDE